jgi:CMP-N-acetylneuraminic acid synthetase
MQPVHHRNGVAYAFERACLIDHHSPSGDRAGALVIDDHHVSIDTEWDLELVEVLVRAVGAH